jgi:hypothetical protein
MYIIITVAHKYGTYIKTVSLADGILKESASTTEKVTQEVRPGALTTRTHPQRVCLSQ